MTNLTARIAGVATLALAALPAFALTTAAHAANHVPATVRVADLNLSSADGQALFAQRTAAAAHQFCKSETSLNQKAGCEAGVRSEVTEKAQGQIRLAASN